MVDVDSKETGLRSQGDCEAKSRYSQPSVCKREDRVREQPGNKRLGALSQALPISTYT